MTIYSGFSHEKWWCSIVMLVYQRVPRKIATPPPRLTACCCSTRCRSDNMLLVVEELSYAEWMNIRAVSNQKSCFNSWETGNSTGKKWKKKGYPECFIDLRKSIYCFPCELLPWWWPATNPGHQTSNSQQIWAVGEISKSNMSVD